MTLSSAYIDLFIRGKSPGEMSGYPVKQSLQVGLELNIDLCLVPNILMITIVTYDNNN